MAMRRVGRSWLVVVLLGGGAALFGAGCGGKRVPVTGTVTLDGEPLDGILLTFSPDAAKGNTSQISCNSMVKDGRYELRTNAVTRAESGSGVPPGWYKVIVLPPPGAAHPRKKGQAPVAIPSKYQTVEKTPLEIEVKDNPQPGEYDLKLTK